LYELASRHGIDHGRGVCIDGLYDDFTIARAQARLWPQTERIKAAAILAQNASASAEREQYLVDVTLAAEGLRLYLRTEVPGLWYDKMLPGGTFVDEPAPASSLYHIACAILDADARGCRV
jgi:mannose-6-phosphate isomerase